MPSVQDLRQPLRRSVLRGLRMIGRDKRWVTTFVMLCLVMTLLQSLAAGLIAMGGIKSLLTAKAGIHVEVLKSAQDQQVQELYAALKELPYVSEVTYVPKAKAYELEKARDPELIKSLEAFQVSNPFPDTFSVVLSTLDSFNALTAFLDQPQWKDTVDPLFLATVTSQEQEVRTYLEVSRSVTALGVLLLWLGIIALLLIIIDIGAQRALERRKELSLETSLGASTMQTLVPFATEVGALLIGSLVVGSLAVALLLALIPWVVPGFVPGGAFAEARSYVVPLLTFVFPLVILAEVVVLPLLGLLGSFLGSRFALTAHPRHA